MLFICYLLLIYFCLCTYKLTKILLFFWSLGPIPTVLPGCSGVPGKLWSLCNITPTGRTFLEESTISSEPYPLTSLSPCSLMRRLQGALMRRLPQQEMEGFGGKRTEQALPGLVPWFCHKPQHPRTQWRPKNQSWKTCSHASFWFVTELLSIPNFCLPLMAKTIFLLLSFIFFITMLL